MLFFSPKTFITRDWYILEAGGILRVPAYNMLCDFGCYHRGVIRGGVDSMTWGTVFVWITQPKHAAGGVTVLFVQECLQCARVPCLGWGRVNMGRV